MNEPRLATRRAIRVAGYATAAGLALLAATGCGAGSTSPGVAHISSTSSKSASPHGSSASIAANALAFTHCMRAHGVPEWPDPINGHIGFLVHTPIAAVFDTPRVQGAYHQCTSNIFGPPKITPAQTAENLAAAVKYSNCMRSHGASDFPDPDKTGFITLKNSTYYYSPLVQRANQACKSLRPPGGIGWGVN